jgi:putative ABC transport system permease protein
LRSLSHLWKRLAPDLASRHVEEELDDEILDHIDRLVQDLISKGLSPAEAEAEGLRLADRFRKARAPIALEDRKSIQGEWITERWVSTTVVFREVLRTLRTGWKVVAVLSLVYAFGLSVAGGGLGVGYSVRKWLPGARDPGSIHLVLRSRQAVSTSYTYEVDFGTARALNAHPEDHQMMAETRARSFPVLDLSGGALASEYPAARVSFVSPHYFDLMGIEPLLGKLLGPSSSASGPNPAVLTREFWQDAFRGDPNVLGKQMRVGGLLVQVAGVLPAGFQGVSPQGFQIALPLILGPVGIEAFMAGNGVHSQYLRPMLLFRDPGGERSEPTLVHGKELIERLEGEDREYSLSGVVVGFAGGASPLHFVLAVSALVLLLAAATGRGLVVLGGLRNARNDSVARTLGATKAHLRGKAFVLGLVPILLGLVLSVVPASMTMEFFRASILDWEIPPSRLISESGFLGLLALCGAFLVVGTLLLPGGGGRRATHLGSGGTVFLSGVRGFEGTLSMALTVQLLVSGCLLTSTGLLWRSWTALSSQDIGYDAHRLWVAPVGSFLLHPTQGALAEARLDSLAHRIGELPQVESVAWTDARPMWILNGRRVFHADGEPVLLKDGGNPYAESVEASFFSTAGLEVLSGRVFRGADEVMVSEVAASSIWPESYPLDQCLHVSDEDRPCARVVGVVENVRPTLESPPAVMVYQQLSAGAAYRNGLLIRSRSGVMGELALLLDAEVSALFPSSSPVYRVREESLKQLSDQRTGYRVAGMLATIALFFSMVGYFSLYSLKVARTRGELAVRVAIGATPVGLFRDVALGATLRLLPALALIAGTLYLGGFFLRPLLRGFPLVDPLVISATVVCLLVVTLISVAGPALDAMRVDPSEALKVEI